MNSDKYRLAGFDFYMGDERRQRAPRPGRLPTLQGGQHPPAQHVNLIVSQFEGGEIGDLGLLEMDVTRDLLLEPLGLVEATQQGRRGGSLGHWFMTKIDARSFSFSNGLRPLLSL